MIKLDDFRTTMRESQIYRRLGRRLRLELSSVARTFATPIVGRAPDRSNVCVMFHVGRSGSTVLADMLDQLPDVISDSEIYTDYRDRDALRQRFANASEYTETKIVSRRRLLRGGGTYLFECKFPNSVDMRLFPFGIEGYVGYLRSLGMQHAIMLRRKNLLRRFVSNRLATESGRYHWKPGEVPHLPRVDLDVDRIAFGPGFYTLLDAISLVEQEFGRLEGAFRESGIAWLDLVYEDDIETNPSIGYRKACAYLGVQAAGVTPRYARINARPLSQIIMNFDAVADVLDGTPHAWMLDG
ncbi:hypothetical protein [Mesorhizobium sp. CAU 1732]|uniref:hypothetical protein n=1 Tax=Mesorhizobium sp. CAU 1732 TaxID=3140358 RepID=UPI003260E3F3